MATLAWPPIVALKVDRRRSAVGVHAPGAQRRDQRRGDLTASRFDALPKGGQASAQFRRLRLAFSQVNGSQDHVGAILVLSQVNVFSEPDSCAQMPTLFLFSEPDCS